MFNESLNYKFNIWKFQAQTSREHVVYRNCFWHWEQFLYTTCSPHVLQKEELLTKIYLYPWGSGFRCEKARDSPLLRTMPFLPNAIFCLMKKGLWRQKAEGDLHFYPPSLFFAMPIWFCLKGVITQVTFVRFLGSRHRLRTPREAIAFTARPKTHSHSQIFRYGRSIFCLPHQPNFSDSFDLCLHWVSVVRGSRYFQATSDDIWRR